MLGQGGERDQHLAGLIRDSQSGVLFATGDYATAMAHAEEAVRLLEATSPRSLHFARSLTSLGRMKRLMGDPAAALELNQRAIRLLEAVRDFDGAAHATHASALALLELKGISEYSRMMDRALVYAQQSTRATTLPNILTHYAETLAGSGAEDVSLAQDLIGRVDGTYASPGWRSGRGRVSSTGSAGMTKPSRRSIVRLLPKPVPPCTSRHCSTSNVRSRSKRLGRTPEAIESLGRAITIIESVRQRLIPADETRHSYAERWRFALSRHVNCSRRMGRWRRRSRPPNGHAPGHSSICWRRKTMNHAASVRPTPMAAARAAPLAVRGSNSAAPVDPRRSPCGSQRTSASRPGWTAPRGAGCGYRRTANDAGRDQVGNRGACHALSRLLGRRQPDTHLGRGAGWPHHRREE